jgi:hypothetical protein
MHTCQSVSIVQGSVPSIIRMNCEKHPFKTVHLLITDHDTCQDNALEVITHSYKQSKWHVIKFGFVCRVEYYCVHEILILHPACTCCPYQILDSVFFIRLHPKHELWVFSTQFIKCIYCFF